ncbi:hypothetical protein KZO01_19380 [Kurthia zopfii]|uniref:Uncharacterized protein (TIGR01655 family) n=1 Tax=Kurthia zopfii TaxID=1650 RepID=A0A2U3AAA5_9BACL|nr:YxeA family protein [Kurthia zopfii]PWI21473.1 hypothetical protein DF281_12135 [Kurthia zopfii]TDR34542.1 uncharacterized protein (TIGR01655 family) [Kurthia zopfii]STX11015.1 Uncharacterized protein conserved in bacteria [Kurthia zopfii]VEI05612.1 Uncharacterized protein conserved in bacteria [Kurthia zopfii]GEK31629.1 hypothetical protein KZO01_19380 [Kurthia zopfii]
MQTIFKLLLTFTIGVGTVLGTVYAFSGDRFMPWVEKDIVYAKSHIAESTKNRAGLHTYTTTVVDENGHKRKVTFNTPNVLKEGSYLKLHAKGTYIASWDLIHSKDVPNKALNRLY